MNILTPQPSVTNEQNQSKKLFLKVQIQRMKASMDIYMHIHSKMKAIVQCLLQRATTTTKKSEIRQSESKQTESQSQLSKGILQMLQDVKKQINEQLQVKSVSPSQGAEQFNQSCSNQNQIKMSAQLSNFLFEENDELKYMFPKITQSYCKYIKKYEAMLNERQNQLQNIENAKYINEDDKQNLLQNLQKENTDRKTIKTISSFNVNKKLSEIVTKEIAFLKLNERRLTQYRDQLTAYIEEMVIKENQRRVQMEKQILTQEQNKSVSNGIQGSTNNDSSKSVQKVQKSVEMTILRECEDDEDEQSHCGEPRNSLKGELGTIEAKRLQNNDIDMGMDINCGHQKKRGSLASTRSSSFYNHNEPNPKESDPTTNQQENQSDPKPNLNSKSDENDFQTPVAKVKPVVRKQLPTLKSHSPSSVTNRKDSEMCAVQKATLIYHKEKYFNDELERKIHKLQRRLSKKQQINSRLSKAIDQIEKTAQNIQWEKVCDSTLMIGIGQSHKQNNSLEMSLLDRTKLNISRSRFHSPSTFMDNSMSICDVSRFSIDRSVINTKKKS